MPVDWSATLADAPALKRDGVFLLEGRLLLERLLASASGGAQVVAVLATAAAARTLDLDARLPGRVDVRTPAEMAAVTGFNFHRGVLALVRRPPMPRLDEILANTDCHPPTADCVWSEADGRRPNADGRVQDCRPPTADCRTVFVVLEHLVDADNVGSCFRNARAFGAAAVLVDDRSVDPLYRKSVRTSMGAVLDIPWTVAPIGTIVEALAARGVTTVALTPQADTPLRAASNDIGRRAPLALLVGNEGAGLSAETLARCTHRAAIPMAPGADSLNVATALAVGLYQVSGLESQA